MSTIRVPTFAANVYRDLRDRRLLLPAAALIVALVAMPMLLAKDDPAPPPPPPPAVPSSAATVPAVLADSEVSVRDYRERLEELKSKNPFSQQFEVSTETVGDSTADTGASTGGTTATDGGFPAVDAATPAPPATGSGSGSDTGPGGGTADNTNGDSDDGDVRVVNQLFVRRVDLMVGIQGDLQRRRGVQPMTVLPDEGTPVLAYLGTDEAGKRAAFVVSSDVTSVGGDGACVPSPNCLFITLEKGESATLDYAPDGQTYELRLQAIRNVKLKTD
jgi:hypothetical protein